MAPASLVPVGCARTGVSALHRGSTGATQMKVFAEEFIESGQALLLLLFGGWIAWIAQGLCVPLDLLHRPITDLGIQGVLRIYAEALIVKAAVEGLLA